MDILIRASIAGTVVVGLMWLVGRALPLTPSIRTALWWCASVKFLLALVWTTPVVLPVLPAAAPTVSSQLVVAAPARAASGATASFDVRAADVGTVPVAETTSPGIGWRPIALSIWAAGALAAGLVGLRRWRTMRLIVEHSIPAPPEWTSIVVDLSQRCGLGRQPVLRVSDATTTPLVTGVRRPVIVLPALSASLLSPERRRMAIAHEIVHIRRRDVLLGCVPAAAEAVFFFHPLARFAAREYAFWREAAVDRAVVDLLDLSPREYGQLLLDLGVSRGRTGLAVAEASPSRSHLRRRLMMLGKPFMAGLGARVAGFGAVAGAAAMLVPVQAVPRQASAVDVAVVADVQVTPTIDTVAIPVVKPIATPAVRPHPNAEPTPVLMVQSDGTPPAPVAPLAPAVPATPTAPVVPVAPSAPVVPAAPVGRVVTIDTGQSGDRDAFVVTLDGDRAISHGSSSDADRARTFRSGNEPLLWFRRDGREFLVRDPAAIEQVREIWEPVSRIGERMGEVGEHQGEIGRRQGEIGAQQGRIGAAQGELGAKQGVLGARLAEIATRLARFRDETGRAELVAERRAVEAEMAELNARMEALRSEIDDLRQPVDDLRAPMEALNRQLESLHADLDRASDDATRQTDALLDRLVEDGRATPVE